MDGKRPAGYGSLQGEHPSYPPQACHPAQSTPTSLIPTHSTAHSTDQSHSLTPNFPTQQEVAKKRTRRTVKSQRGIVGASLDVIKEKRSQRPEARQAARTAAIKKGKEEKAEKETTKKAGKAKSSVKSTAGQTKANVVSKQQSKGGAVGGAAKGKGR